MLKSITRKYSKPLLNFLELRCFSAEANIKLHERGHNYKCRESNPINHSKDNIAQFYSLPRDDKKVLFTHGGLPTTFKNHCETFNETCIMIREPALDIFNSLKQIDYSKPANKFVLYGLKGSGKSLSLAHILHYGYKSGFILVHVPWVGNWMRRCKESSNSIVEEGFIDLNIDAAIWLTHFKTQNSHLLQNEQFRVSKEYVWNRREKTVENSPIVDLIDFGVNRIKYASSCVIALVDEIKRLSKAGSCRTLVVIDGFNAFFHPNTRIFKDKKQMVLPHEVTLTKAFLSLTNFDWNNAAIVLTVDEIAAGQLDSPSYFPRYLLGKEGFEHLDPFIPIPVRNYSEKEFLSCIDYYRERKWIQQYYPGLERELAFVSNSNPYKLLEVAAPL